MYSNPQEFSPQGSGYPQGDGHQEMTAMGVPQQGGGGPNQTTTTSSGTNASPKIRSNLDTTKVGPFEPDEEAVIIKAMSDRIRDSRVGLEQLILEPNASNVEEVVARLNEGRDAITSSFFVGTLIPEGCIGVAEKNGITSAVGPGRWTLLHPRSGWVEKQLNIMRHPVVKCGPVTVIRVPNGQLGLVLDGNVPKILSGTTGGWYAANNAEFQHVGFVDVNQQHIQHSTIHIIRVPKGQYACVWDDNSPALLPQGEHVVKSKYFSVDRFVPVQQESFSHGTITRFFVKAGSMGLAWSDNEPTFYTEPGIYLVDNPMFSFVGNVDIEEREIELGARKIITVRDGEVGVSHDNGELVVLPPGRHFIEKPGHVFDEFLSTQQECLNLYKEDVQGGVETNLMICESKELVKIGIQAAVFYHVQNPKLAIVKIGSKANIQRFINETATAVITTIVRSTGLSEIAQGGGAAGGGSSGGSYGQQQATKRANRKQAQHTASSPTTTSADQEEQQRDGQKGDDDLAPPPFFDRVHDDFIKRLEANFLREYGILMLNVRIGDFKVLDRAISDTISNHALIMAETQANLSNLEGKRKIDLVNKDSDARIEKIQASVEANEIITRTRAEADTIREQAQATAEARTINADAQAKSVTIIADAQALATKLRGDAEAERAGKLGSIPFGRESTLAEIRANMVRNSLSGVDKTVYMPTDNSANPFALFTAKAFEDMKK